ncbi:hypothetical protein [Kingella oralis]|uniref:hypothetical protein n=1 Tax=Kingella oralis TaxID=505 RepID=UPI0034E56916
MPVFSRKGIDCPQCAEFKTRVKMEGAAHLQRTLCHVETAVSQGILRDVGKEIDPHGVTRWRNAVPWAAGATASAGMTAYRCILNAPVAGGVTICAAILITAMCGGNKRFNNRND